MFVWATLIYYPQGAPRKTSSFTTRARSHCCYIQPMRRMSACHGWINRDQLDALPFCASFTRSLHLLKFTLKSLTARWNYPPFSHCLAHTLSPGLNPPKHSSRSRAGRCDVVPVTSSSLSTPVFRGEWRAGAFVVGCRFSCAVVPLVSSGCGGGNGTNYGLTARMGALSARLRINTNQV